MALSDYETLFRYFHILSGITWIGLLYFFNLVNLPLLKIKLSKPYGVDMAEKATANITLKSLFWFRWGAMFTLIFGLLLLEVERQQYGSMAGYLFENGPAGWLIFVGIMLALTMWANVWFVIWPKQQQILGNNKKIAAGVDDEEKARLETENGPLVKQAVFASRYNTWASIPMLFGMVFGAHGGAAASWADMTYELLVLGVVLLLMIIYSRSKN